MNFLRNTTSIVLALTGTLLLAASVHAADVSMANGSVHFSTPDTWVAIMQTQGDPETQVFQVPDSSPTGKTSLARITVTVTHATDISAFHQFMSDDTAKAMELPGYKAPRVPQGPNSNVYSAFENSVEFDYTEHYWFKNGLAIQLRCVRPAKTLAGETWNADFDKGCAAIAAQLK